VQLQPDIIVYKLKQLSHVQANNCSQLQDIRPEQTEIPAESSCTAVKKNPKITFTTTASYSFWMPMLSVKYEVAKTNENITPGRIYSKDDQE
jgi:hypothetical protein